MSRLGFIISIFALVMLVSCQSEATIPTLAQLPTASLIPILPTNTATVALSPTATSVTLAASTTITPSPTITPTSGIVIRITLTPEDTPLPQPPTGTATPLPQAFIFGRSVQGRDLTAYRYGTGRHIILLVGGIHTGFEANTVDLMNELRSHYALNPQDIAAEITLLIVPVLNVDGLTYGRALRGRFNGNNVDLNRNWACGWSAEAEFGNGEVNPGTQPFSEPETIALGSLIQRTLPAAVLFYHSAANGIFAGDCEDSTGVSVELAVVYGEASRYPYGEPFTAYSVSGTAPSWVDSMGIPAVDIELASARQTEFNRNFRAIQAVQQWVIGQ